MRAVVFGYGGMGCLGLEALLRHGFDVVAVFTHSDDPSGREQIWWSSMAELAKSHEIPVHFQDTAKDPGVVALVVNARPDILFSFYYRHMLSDDVLAVPPQGGLNLHGSLLPRTRGRAPINWTLVNGDTEAGISLHTMVTKPDAGDLVDQEACAVDPAETAYTLYHKLESAGRQLLDRALPAIRSGTFSKTPMDLSKGTYFGGRKPEDGRIDWHADAQHIYDLIRAVTHPYPGAFTSWNGQRLFVWWALPIPGATTTAKPGTVLATTLQGVDVATGDGVLRLVTVQFEGKPQQPAASLFPSLPIRPGDGLGEKAQG